MAKRLNLSLGKVNYCIKALKQKGYIKIKNFKKNKKISYAYILTPKDNKRKKSKLTINFMKRKLKSMKI